MGGIVNNPNDPNNPFFGTDADPRFPRPIPQQPQTPGPITSQAPSYLQPYVQNALNANIPMQDLIQGQNTPLAFNSTRFTEPLRLPTQIQSTPMLQPGSQVFNGVVPAPQQQQQLQKQYYGQQPQGMVPKPTPIPGRPIIEPPRPGYGQKPQRGPVDRGMTPVMLALQQGLGGLANRI